MKPRLARWQWVLAAILVVRLLGFWAALRHGVQPSPPTDPLEYRSVALNLIDHGTFSIAPADQHDPDLMRSPGYPLFLAATYLVDRSGKLAILLQQLMVVAMCAMLFLFLRARGVGERASLIATAFFAFEPIAWLYTLLTMSETLCAFLLMSAMYLLLGRKREPGLAGLVGASALVGCAILVRPTTLLLAPFFVVLAFVRAGKSWPIRWRAAVLSGGIILLVLTPWLIRNDRLVGSPTLGASGYYNLIQGFGTAQERARNTSGPFALAAPGGGRGAVFYGFTQSGYPFLRDTAHAIVQRYGLLTLLARQFGCSPRPWIDHYFPIVDEFGWRGTPLETLSRIIDDLIWLPLAFLFYAALIASFYVKEAEERWTLWALYGMVFATSLVNVCLAYFRQMIPLYPILLLGAASGAERLLALGKRR